MAQRLPLGLQGLAMVRYTLDRHNFHPLIPSSPQPYIPPTLASAAFSAHVARARAQ